MKEPYRFIIEHKRCIKAVFGQIPCKRAIQIAKFNRGKRYVEFKH
jgi:hypothetical protein